MLNGSREEGGRKLHHELSVAQASKTCGFGQSESDVEILHFSSDFLYAGGQESCISPVVPTVSQPARALVALVHCSGHSSLPGLGTGD